MTVEVPQRYVPYITQASAATGLPYNVVAAQTSVESGFHENARSPVGAMGPVQFMPGTWAIYGKGDPDKLPNAYKAYAKYMNALLHEENGSVEKALAAYNAGPGNIPAGIGYADHVLSLAGAGTDITDPGKGAIPAKTDSIISSLNPLPWLEDALGISDFTDLLERGSLMLFGGILIIVGIIKFTKTSPPKSPSQAASKANNLPNDVEAEQKNVSKQRTEALNSASAPE